MMGLMGHGDAFVLRDPHAIRPVYWYMDDEVVVAASERPAIQTAFNVPLEKVQEIPGGSALVIKHSGKVAVDSVLEPQQRTACSFERIYFSRGTDHDIYNERKKLGYHLAQFVLNAVDNDLENTVFSFVPNTAEVAFYGMLKGIEDWLINYKIDQIEEHKENLDSKELQNILNWRPRVEKVAVKDVKMRTFITEDQSRDELVSHVYDITYGSVRRNQDTLVILDDSIVRGTTLRRSILSILDRLGPKKIIVVSSAPQIRYPDCYGIDMSKFGDFVAFRAAVSLIKKRGMDNLLREVYDDCKADLEKPIAKGGCNHVKRIYEPFTYEELSSEIASIIKPQHIFSEVQVIYQTIEALHDACPHHQGDWYFSGNFPTPGGARVVNKAFTYFMEGRNERAY
jgi:amidophosphoribosyltransferase